MWNDHPGGTRAFCSMTASPFRWLVRDCGTRIQDPPRLTHKSRWNDTKVELHPTTRSLKRVYNLYASTASCLQRSLAARLKKHPLGVCWSMCNVKLSCQDSTPWSTCSTRNTERFYSRIDHTDRFCPLVCTNTASSNAGAVLIHKKSRRQRTNLQHVSKHHTSGWM